MNTSKVGIIFRDTNGYPQIHKAYKPSSHYPEMDNCREIDQDNLIYEMVRESFHMMGYDSENFGKKDWNPLKKFISPGEKVLLKPNLVMDHNPNGGNTDCLYTSPFVVAPVIDYVLIALKGKGEIIIGDAPVQSCDFERLIEKSGYKDLLLFYQRIAGQVKISLMDFRDLVLKKDNGIYHQIITEKTKGTVVNLKDESEFCNMDQDCFRRLRITSYSSQQMIRHHNASTNEYCISSQVLNADVIINLPKPKTHRKAGVTIALKNIVGINTRKEYLPHHTQGAKKEGGDEYLDKNFGKRILSKILDYRNYYFSKNKYYRVKALDFFSHVCKGLNIILKTKDDGYYEGSWFGNDTISKTIVDLNKILLFSDKTGVIKNTKQRKYLIVADMIVSGEGEGPLLPSPKKTNIIAVGENPVSFDIVIATIMGAKLEMIPTIQRAILPKGILRLKDYDAIEVLSNDNRWNNINIKEIDNDSILFFSPSKGWLPAFKKESSPK